jgi:hypothetical protein
MLIDLCKLVFIFLGIIILAYLPVIHASSSSW